MSSVKVKVDFRGLTSAVQARADIVIDRVLDILTEYATDNVRRLSSERLSIETWQQYSRAITTTKTANKATIAITDPKMAAIEVGVSSFDIKPGLLNSSKAQTSATGGRYIDVPFQHTTTKRGAGERLPTSLRGMVNKAMHAAKTKGTKTRLFKKDKAAHHGDLVVHPAGQGGAEAHTFRRVSTNSAPGSWIYPNRPGIGVFEEVAKGIDEIKDRVVADVVREIDR